MVYTRSGAALAYLLLAVTGSGLARKQSRHVSSPNTTKAHKATPSASHEIDPHAPKIFVVGMPKSGTSSLAVGSPNIPTIDPNPNPNPNPKRRCTSNARDAKCTIGLVCRK